MKALVCNKPYEFEYKNLPMPTVQPQEVQIRVLAIGICGTDIHAYTGNQPFFEYPRVLGHELCGEITATGEGVTNYQVGDRVAVIPYVSCGQCASCESGRTNCCENISVIGVHRDGGFCEYLNVPTENVLPVGNVDPKTAALIEPFAISAHAVRRAAVKPGSHVLVVGAGPIGLGAAAIAAAAGANVIVADTSSERLGHVNEQLNLPAFSPLSSDFENSIKAHFNGNLAEIVIDATGNAKAMNGAVNLIRHGGTIVFVGLFKGNLEISDPDFHKKETTMMGSRNATMEDFQKVQELMAAQKLSADMMLTHTFEFDSVGNNYQTEVVENTSLLKGVISF